MTSDYRGPAPTPEHTLDDVTLARFIVTIEHARRDIDDIRRASDHTLQEFRQELASISAVFLTKEEFRPVQRAVYGLILAMTLLAVGAVVALVIAV